MNNELLEEYPEFKDKKNITLERIKICPIGERTDDNRKAIITKDFAEKMSSKIKNSPLRYAETDEKLPRHHVDKYKKRKTIGNGLNGFVMEDEKGIEYLVGDFMIFNEDNEDIIANMEKFKEDISASYEIDDAWLDEDGNVKSGIFDGTSIMDKDYSAYHHQGLMLAEKMVDTQVSDNLTVTLDDSLKQIIGDNYKTQIEDINKQLTDKDLEIEEMKKENQTKIEEREENIDLLKVDNELLREMIKGFTSL